MTSRSHRNGRRPSRTILDVEEGPMTVPIREPLALDVEGGPCGASVFEADGGRAIALDVDVVVLEGLAGRNGGALEPLEVVEATFLLGLETAETLRDLLDECLRLEHRPRP